jgi:hypothetical protein
MLSHPAYDATGRRLAAVALRNAVYMFPLGVVAVTCGLTTAPFAYEAALLAAPMALSAAVFYRRPSTTHAPDVSRVARIPPGVSRVSVPSQDTEGGGRAPRASGGERAADGEVVGVERVERGRVDRVGRSRGARRRDGSIEPGAVSIFAAADVGDGGGGRRGRGRAVSAQGGLRAGSVVGRGRRDAAVVGARDAKE